MKKPPLDALTGARFFAAFYVMLIHTFFYDDHMSKWTTAHVAWPIMYFLDRGCIAVNFFFVLSGFVLAYNYCRPDGAMVTSKHDFWVARFARIVPMYFIALMIAAPLFFHDEIYNAVHGGSFLAAAKSTVTNWGATLLFVNAWIPAWNNVNPPSWTLSAEAFFYLLFPFVLGPLGRLPNLTLLRTAAFLYLITMLPTLAFSLRTHTGDLFSARHLNHADGHLESALYNFPLLRFPEFAVGAIMGLIFNRTTTGARPSVWNNAELAGVSFLLAVMFMAAVPWPVVRSSFYTPMSVWVIWSLARRPVGVLGKFLSCAAMVLLGEASYAVYLFHYPVVTFMVRRLILSGLPITVPVMIGLVVVITAVVIPLSIVLYWLIEEPARKYLRKRLSRPKVRKVETWPAAAPLAPENIAS